MRLIEYFRFWFMNKVSVCILSDESHLNVHYILTEFRIEWNRIIEWFGLEETLKVTQFWPSSYGQGHHSLDWVAQGPIQLVLKPFLGLDIHNLSGQAVSVPHCFHTKEFPPNIFFQFKTIFHCPVTIFPYKISLFLLFIIPLFVIPLASKRSPQNLFISRMDNRNFFSLSS